MGTLRTAGLRLHRCFTWNESLARAYAGAWQVVLSHVPEGWLKAHLRNNLIGARWPEDSLGTQRVQLCDGLDVQLQVTPGSLALSKAMFRRRLAHEPEVFSFLLQRQDRYDAVIEIGANIGVYTLLFAKRLVPSDGVVRVMSFEPSRKAYANLLTNLRLNDVTNVSSFNCAVGSRSRLATFHENHRDLMKGSLDGDTAALFSDGGDEIKTTVVVMGLEELRALIQGFSRVLLKIDVIGSEPEVLGELRPLIDDLAPEILLGVWWGNNQELNKIHWIRSRYRLFRVDDAGVSARREFSDRSYCNYFLEPMARAAD